MTPLGAIVRGAIAGAFGTLAMDVVWYRRYRNDGGDQRFSDWELSSGSESYQDAGAPATVGKRLVEGLFDVRLSPASARWMNNAVHWATGLGWGVVHGVRAGSLSGSFIRHGLTSGIAAWVVPYLVLAKAGIYRPIREYEATVLARDLTAHLVFGLVTSATFAMARRR